MRTTKKCLRSWILYLKLKELLGDRVSVVSDVTSGHDDPVWSDDAGESSIVLISPTV